ncbi:MAG: seryl-tRNA synthetase [Rickettsiaceae bacterium]|jgi:methyltransferase-like protein/2-polyprenyl-3-methyl-5-hydroxy-6-metoxy-1,4-benzoquinol methylase|nr:seryl-tRNA synthetase [Rickettsiaceae bacterium]
MLRDVAVAIDDERKRYDELPYESFPFAVSHPGHLRAIGALFGLKAPELNKARVLELGCAAGNNIIPFAANYPKAAVVGIDLSEVQINDAKRQVAALGLKNIDLKTASITDVDVTWGKFDYIICHGVYSWVPEAVQKKILEISSNNLSQNGIAYISFNTLPGWNIAGSVREMMRYHSSNFKDLNEQVKQAKSILGFVNEATQASNNYHSQIFANEVAQIQSGGDIYLRHEYLAEFNKAFYFHEFIRDVEACGLKYLADSNINTMCIENYPDKAIELLNSINDITRVEQYMDFISNRKFRPTLLCHQNINLNRKLTPEIFENYYFHLNFIDQEIKSSEIFNDKEITFHIVGDKNFSTDSSVLKIALVEMFNSGYEYKIRELVAIVAKKLPRLDREIIRKELLNSFIELAKAGYASFSLEKPLYISGISNKPRVSKVALYHARQENQLWTINQKHFKILLNVIDKLIMQCLDGKHDINFIEKYLIENYKKGVIKVTNNGQPAEEKHVKPLVRQYIQATFKKFAGMQLFVE